MIKVVYAVVFSFAGFFALIVALRLKDLVSPAVALLMLIALLGLYLGFGILVLVYRLIVRLEGSDQRPQAPDDSD